MSNKLNTSTPHGSIDITNEALAKIIGDEVLSSYGVAGIVSVSRSTFGKIVSEEEYKQGIIIKKTPKGYIVDIHLAVVYPSKITEIATEVQKKVKYVLNKTFSLTFKEINVYLDTILA